MDEGLLGLIIGMVFDIFLGALAMMSFGKCQNISIDVINQCEENLPRNQTCEIVITAEVKE